MGAGCWCWCGSVGTRERGRRGQVVLGRFWFVRVNCKWRDQGVTKLLLLDAGLLVPALSLLLVRWRGGGERRDAGGSWRGALVCLSGARMVLRSEVCDVEQFGPPRSLLEPCTQTPFSPLPRSHSHSHCNNWRSGVHMFRSVSAAAGVVDALVWSPFSTYPSPP